MTEVKVHGIVTAEAVMGDKDKRLTLLTREMGRITVLAKGALAPKSRWRSVAQVFSCAAYVLTKGKTFYYIKEAELTDSLYELRRDLPCLAWAGLMVETASETAVEGQTNQPLVDLLLRGLMRMRQPESDPALIASVFLWRLLADNGYRPQLGCCRVCGRPDSKQEVWGFAAADGGLICPACQTRYVPDQSLPPEARRALEYIISAPPEAVYRFRAEPDVREALREGACRYLQYQTGGRYRSLDFLQQMVRSG